MSKPQVISVSCIITLLILVIYWPVQHFPFIDYDDNIYVYENVAMQQPDLTAFLKWALMDVHAGHWHPLTWLSHRFDWGLFGSMAGGHHWTNVLLHIANALFLFWLLHLATGEMERSALVALLFAIHPLNVESVAWIAERKNVLSTVFGLSTLIFYVRYTRKPAFGTYLPVLVLFALGLMTKPMLVTLPVLMLLWDYWPLGRLTGKADGGAEQVRRIWRLVYEKMPLLGLSLASAAIAILAAQGGGALRSYEAFPLDVRLMNAVESYVRYLIKTVWPVDLAFYYPYPESFSVAMVLLSAVLLVVLTLYALQKRRERPTWIVGWFWYLIALLPVIGLVQVGFQAMADRYAYWPLIGLLLIACWSIPDAWFRSSRKRITFLVVALLILILSAGTAQQVAYWQDNKTLARHALVVTERNHIAHLMMGNALDREGNRAGAAAHYVLALEAKPDYAEAMNNLGNLYFATARYEEAGTYYRLAVAHNPRNVRAKNNLGVVLLLQGQKTEAAACFRDALRLDPWYRSPREYLRKMGVAAE